MLVIAGPTASGKSALALELAGKLNGEIISADSMQVYRGLDIGTAKPTAAEQAEVPHHLLDVLDIGEPLDVFRWLELADNAITAIRRRRATPIVVGGTGLYLRALIYGLDPLPADGDVKKQILAEFGDAAGFEKLKAIMKHQNPADYAKFSSHHRKLMRAHEVFKLTGKPFSSLQMAWDKTKAGDKATVWRLEWDRDELRRRITDRTDAMLAAGWLDEAERLIAAGLLKSPTAHQALGYKLIARHLAGEMDFRELRAKIITATWQLARRQTTWFKNQHPEANVIDMPSADAANRIIQRGIPPFV